MTGSTPWIGDSRNWSGLACAPLGRKSSGRKIQVRHPASGIVPPHRESITALSEKANWFREWLSPLSGRHQSLQRWFVVNNQGRAL
jgi:hypothetical protein